MALSGGAILLAIVIRLFLTAAVWYAAAELDQNGPLWGLLTFFVLGIWSVPLLVLWYLVTQDQKP